MIVAFSAFCPQRRRVRLPFRCCGILLLLFVGMASAGTAQAADPNSDPQLKQIADAIRAWRESIVNIRVKFEKTFEGGHLLSKEAGERDVTLTRYGMDWIWTDSGKFRIYEWSLQDGQEDGGGLFAVDGKRCYIFRRPRGDPPQQPCKVSIVPVPPGTNRAFTPLDGLWYSGRGLWLSDLLDAGGGEIAGTETIDGRELPKLKVLLAKGHVYWVTIDPERGFLPRAVDYGTVGRERVEIQEFQKLDDPDIWFPLRGTSTGWDHGEIYSRTHWRVTSVKVNRRLPASLFHPEIPDGSHVIDQFGGGNYIKGAKPNFAGKSDSPPSEPADGVQVSGAPQPGFWERWAVPLLLGLCAVLLTVAYWLRRRMSVVVQ